ncbi:MAG TPA: AsmA-like C-terminal region-containing protein, partial [Blastocatellia bacterium]|nr:AsmA-like C-terminal region-containing protein [Blastocatellia bacterium]
MRKKLLIAVAALSGLILLLAIGVFLFIRSGRLDLLLQRQIVAGLEEVGVNAEIGDTRLDIRGSTVTLKDIILKNKEGEKIGEIKELVASFSIVDYLRRKIKIDEVTVTAPEFWVEVNERGRSNLESLSAPEETEEEGPINFFEALVTVTGGKINYVDRRNDIAAQIPNLSITFEPDDDRTPADKINHDLKLSFQQGEATYQGRKIENIAATLNAAVTNETANVEQAEITSGLGSISAAGQISSFKPFKYDFNKVNANLQLDQIARVFAPDRQLSGNVQLVNAQVSGTDANYHINGAIEADQLAVDGFRVTGLRVNTDVDGTGTEYTATGDIATGAASGDGVTINSIRFSDVTAQGKAADFDVSGALTLGQLKSGQVTVSNLRARVEADPDRVTLSNLTAAALGGSVSGQASIAYGGGQSRVNVQFRDVDLNQAAALAAAKDVQVRGTANGSANLTFPGTDFDRVT